MYTSSVLRHSKGHRMMYVYPHLRKCVKDCFSQITVHLHGVDRVGLLCTPRFCLKRSGSYPDTLSLHKRQCPFFSSSNSFTSVRTTGQMPTMPNTFSVPPPSPHSHNIHHSLRRCIPDILDTERTFRTPESKTDLTHQCVFKHVSVFPLIAISRTLSKKSDMSF